MSCPVRSKHHASHAFTASSWPSPGGEWPGRTRRRNTAASVMSASARRSAPVQPREVGNDGAEMEPAARWPAVGPRDDGGTWEGTLRGITTAYTGTIWLRAPLRAAGIPLVGVLGRHEPLHPPEEFEHDQREHSSDAGEPVGVDADRDS